MEINVDITKVEDEIINPLANILYLTFGNEEYNKVAAEVERVIRALVRNNLIKPRMHYRENHGKKIRVGKFSRPE